MTQEEKQLLMQELCARLPYGVKANIPLVDCDERIYTVSFNDMKDFVKGYINIKPYLRPLSSMTDEEKNMLWEELDKDMDILEANIDAPIICEYKGRCYRGNPVYHEIDFLNRNMFDWRGLIPMGLAIEAPEGMYNTKTE